VHINVTSLCFSFKVSGIAFELLPPNSDMPTKAPVKKSASARKTRGRTNAAKRKAPTVDLSKSYNEFKNFEGQQYSGMKVGRSHRWHYDKGEWKETKITPDLWEISYAVTKRRVGKAPEGSGVPVGTEYHWYILAHQNVRKLDANDYTTSLTGLKFKLAHKRADKGKWNTSSNTQKKRLIKLLQEFIAQLQKEAVPIEFEYEGQKYKGEAVPVSQTCAEGTGFEYDVSLNDEHIGIIKRMTHNWRIDNAKDQKFVDAVGEQIENWNQ
ncbi:MAG: hypothetical protein ACXVLT_14950, partial [Flavisolibacter sp.]